jgi:LmbE family N-acetylglucosaminyl deacetylase
MPAEIRRSARDACERMKHNLHGIYLLLSLSKIHQMVMFAIGRNSGSRLTRLRNRFAIALGAVLLATGAAVFTRAQAPEKATPEHSADRPVDHRSDHLADHTADHYYDPLPQDTGASGLKLMLRRLQTTASLMQTDAHPDDEDGGMLTLEARGKGVSTLLMTLNRGEGGQNKLGSNLFDALGVLRTLELLAADRYYGVEQRFSRVADFGYSKTAEETFQKWQGHDIALADMVRVIRTFRPDVLVARFSGTDRDGHGHHQASAILTREAFRAAADPNRFPDQIKEGLEPWQPKKLYIGNVCGFGASTCEPANYTVKLNTGKEDLVLGTSYVQFALQGLHHQESQGVGAFTVPPGDRFTFYKLVDSVVDSAKDKDGHEQDFFDGIDTTLPGLASGLDRQEKQAPWLRDELAAIKAKIDEATVAAEKDPSGALEPLTAGSGQIGKLIERIEKSELSSQAKNNILPKLTEKWSEIAKALALARGAALHVLVDAPVGTSPEDAFMAVPGQTFEVTAILSAADRSTTNSGITLLLPPGWNSKILSKRAEANGVAARFKVYVPPTAELTKPYWHRNDPETEALNIIDDPRYQNLPFPPPPVKALGVIGKPGGGDISATCMVRYKDASGEIAERPLAVAPAFSVLLDPSEQVIPTEDGPQSTVKVDVSSNLDAKTMQETHWKGDPERDEGLLQVAGPENWRIDPAEKPLAFHERGEKQSADFTVHPGSRTEGRKEIQASLTSGHQNYKEGYSVVTREDLGTFYYYQPAVQRISVVDVKVPKDLNVGYIMGAGDEIPTVLQEIGVDVVLIPAEKLGVEDLSRYQTIVLGIRAYDTQKDVVANNKRLLDFVQAGGRVVVQYNTLNSAAGDFNKGNFTPYSATLGRARVSVEEAPIVILDPANPIFHSPNEITQKDFDGWVQERGLYFMTQWDNNFTPLLESHDPDESEQRGGLLVAHYGKGTYIYTGYAFFRQLPAGVPGAVRLFVNLISSR